VTQSDRLRLAVFIDFDNIEIGVKNTLGASFDAGLVFEALKERGEVVAKTAYSDWQRSGHYSRALTQHAIRMVQRNMTPGGDKNGADINLALDALEMAFTHPHINAFVIVGGASDFISLVEKLKQYDKKVFVVGGRQFTSGIMQRNCHEFIAYENLAGAGAAPTHAPAGGRRPGARPDRPERMPVEQAIPLVTRALKVLSEREVSPQLGLLKSTLLQLDSTFSERNYGAGSFRDFAERLEKAGVVRIHHGKGGLLVEMADGTAHMETAASPAEEHGAEAPAAAAAPASTPAAVAGTPGDGVRELKRLLAAAQIRKWPLYLRNVKQVIRQSGSNFDERAYGFGSLVDLLRAAQKEGMLRVDRDRHGVIRVFQANGAAAHPVEVETAEAAEHAEAADAGEPAEDMPHPVAVPEPAVSEFVTPELAADELPGDNIGNLAGTAAPPLVKGRRRRPVRADAPRPSRSRRSKKDS